MSHLRSAGKRLGSLRRVGLAPLALALLCGASAELTAQQPAHGHRVQLGGERPTGITRVQPRSGPPGTIIDIQSRSLPPDVTVQIMIGALRSGFEVIGVAATNDDGEFGGSGTVRVAIPEWVQRDRSYLLIVTDRGYNPLASADIFHATDQHGLVLREGRIVEDESACPTLENEGGEIYFLAGAGAGLEVGNQVSVEGPIIDSEACGRGITIDVRQVRLTPAR